MPLTFPTHLFNPANIRLALQGRSITSPPSISGVGQALRTDGGGFWTVDMSGISLNTDDKVRAWRAWLNELDAGVTRVNVPIADVRMAPRPLHGKKLARPSGLQSGSDDAYFPEAVAFASPLVIATANPAPLRATQLSITIVQGSRLKGGEHFEIAHPAMGKRVYRVGRVMAQTGQTSIVSIRPPLREAFPGGDINFDWPTMEMVATNANEAEPDLQYGRSAGVSISFREAF